MKHRAVSEAKAEAMIETAGARHQLVVEPDGLTYIAEHADGEHDPLVCDALTTAWEAFYERVIVPELDGDGSLPDALGAGAGTYWCDLDSNGNLAVGGRVTS